MTKKQRAQTVMTELEKLYPVIPIPLDHTDPYTLLVAVALSAQTTDKKVNQITPKLFEVAGDPFRMKDLEVDEIKYIDIAFGHWLVISRNRLIPSILNMVEKLGVYSTVQYINDNFGDGCKTLVADSFEALRLYDRKGNLLSGGNDDEKQQNAKIILKENPYPSGSPSFDFWQQKYGLFESV